MQGYLQTPIEYLKGVGSARAALLQKELGIFHFEDLLEYYPFRYVDRTRFHTVRELRHLEGFAQLKGRITRIHSTGAGRGKRLVASFTDQTGSIDLVWFKGLKWIEKSIQVGTEILVYGKAKRFGANWNITHPEIETLNEELSARFEPVYHSGEKLSAKGLTTKGIAKLTQNLVANIKGKIPETLPQEVVEQYRLMPREEALIKVHAPANLEEAKRAQFRLKFEELLFLQLELLMRKKILASKSAGFAFEHVGEVFNAFYANHLPFELTGAQKRVLKEIRLDLRKGEQMNRLLQGDVGSGKTLVALLTMLFAVGNGFQAAIMAPTEILAKQHFESISELLAKMDLKVALLTGSSKTKERRILHEGLESGEIDILIGTHALIEPKVKFKNLGMVVIDEQHRFGVAQRAKLQKKNVRPPHVLVMTATPIPRTLAMTAYGDLDVSVIDELPPGRKPVDTQHRYENARPQVFSLLKREISKGRQVYVVYPLIEESENMDYLNLMDGFESIQRSFPRPEYQISMVHGKMKPEDKEFEMQMFAQGKTQIMVATTVIEVGVNVPNASVMIIESAERFGLSQLHQLRGRVGRGAEKSYCFLMSGDKVSKEGKRRLETMVETNDGFRISEVDLELRGPGDIMGTQQSGLLNLKIADLVTDGPIVTIARETARNMLKIDPKLQEPKHAYIRTRLKTIMRSKPNWSKIA